MYKMLIVDDDSVVRANFSTLIDWSQFGITLLHGAENGKVALSTILNQRVDILLVDVKMPIMDGIELLKVLNQKEIKPLIIMLSAYEDYSLVREAFKLGVEDYVLKSNLREKECSEMAQKIIKKLEKRAIIPEVDSDNENSIIFKKYQSLVNSVVLKKNMPINTIELSTLPCVATMIVLDETKRIIERFSKDFKQMLELPIKQIVEQLPQLRYHYQLIKVNEYIYFLFYYNDNKTSSEIFYKISQKIHEKLINFMNLSNSNIISNKANTEKELINNINDLYNKRHIFLLFNKNSSLMQNDLSLPKTVNIEPIEKMISVAKYNEKDLEYYINIIQSDNMTDTLDDKKNYLTSIIYCILKTVSIINIDIRDQLFAEKRDNITDEIFKLETSWQISFYLKGFIKKIIQITNSNTIKNKLSLEEKAKVFIEENYNNSSLTLSSIAEHFNLNEKYFATLFRKQAGTTVYSYLTKIRMEEAQEILQQSNLKVYEVATKVGFYSVNSFSRTYKKYFGYPPKQINNK